MAAILDALNKEAFNRNEVEIITERVDDVPLLIGQMIRMELQEVLDRHIPKHWRQRGLSWGWTAVIWLAYILTEGDHRKVSMEEYVKGMKNTLSQLTGQMIDPLDFSDDRLSHLLTHLSNQEYWLGIEDDLNNQSIEVYELEVETVRCDATSVSCHHKTKEGGLVQFGHSKDDPTLPQIKMMSGALDPLGMPLATDVVSGEKADDGLYIPIIDRIINGLNRIGMLFVGDCKMSALEIRAHLISTRQHYLAPLPMTGNTILEMEGWIDMGIKKELEGKLIDVFRKNYRDEDVLAARGYEFDRIQRYEKEGVEVIWTERVQIINSPAHAKKQIAGLEQRLKNAEQKIKALTPKRGRGKRQITKEDELQESIAGIIKTHHVENLLHVEYEKQTEYKTKFVGRGRGSANRKIQTEEKIRYQISDVKRKEEEIAFIKKRFGWKAFVTDTSIEQLSLHDSVLSYRDEYRVERIFNRIKSRLDIAPLYVKKDDQIEGLTYLLTLGVRVMTLLEFVVRRSLQKDGVKLPDMHPENRQKMTDNPSAERILRAFSGITLTIIKDKLGNELLRWLPPLTSSQQEIIKRLNLNDSLYQRLGIQNVEV